jgi:hypothetical protein
MTTKKAGTSKTPTKKKAAASAVMTGRSATNIPRRASTNIPRSGRKLQGSAKLVAKEAPIMYKGEPLTDERAEQLAHEALAQLDAMSDEELKANTYPGGYRESERRAGRTGRPSIGSDIPAGVSTAVQVRFPTDTLARLDAMASQFAASRSFILRLAVDEYLAHHTEDWDGS